MNEMNIICFREIFKMSNPKIVDLYSSYTLRRTAGIAKTNLSTLFNLKFLKMFTINQLSSKRIPPFSSPQGFFGPVGVFLLLIMYFGKGQKGHANN